jgi:hypothetical protein
LTLTFSAPVAISILHCRLNCISCSAWVITYSTDISFWLYCDIYLLCVTKLNPYSTIRMTIVHRKHQTVFCPTDHDDIATYSNSHSHRTRASVTPEIASIDSFVLRSLPPRDGRIPH